ncbi:MAG: efflux RND transporter periplasmic adaptor subunit [Proteobacteria bacterium]|nr:efflux RND transporter periplasmic adaptor subunit [Pseudomonadota bacterium]
MKSRNTRWIVSLAIALPVMAGTGYLLHQPPAHAGNAAQLPAVAVSPVMRADLFRTLTIPAEFRPYNEVDVHAKVAGFVRDMKVDIGDKVRARQLLAVLEVPELQDELQHAIATQARAAAEYGDAHLAYTRLLAVNREHPNLIAQQDVDSAAAHDATSASALAAARSDVNKYRALVGYTRITAPFGGVVTRRYADPGTLIQAGTASSTQSTPLVRISDNERLRLDFPVSVDYVSSVRVGAPVSVRVDSLGGRIIEGRIARLADRVDDATRTMVVEMELPNPDGQLVAGMYATVTLRADERPRALSVPLQAVSAGGHEVWVVDGSDRLQQRTVQLGMETADRHEVLSGLKEGERVVLGGGSQLVAGERVTPRAVAVAVATQE